MSCMLMSISSLIGQVMKKRAGMIAALCMLSSIFFAPAKALAQSSRAIDPYFSGYSSDGAPVRKDYCGVNYDKKGWLVRDLEGGLRSEVGATYEAGKSLTLTVLFRFSDEKRGKFEFLPEEVKLYAHPGEKLLKPSSIERKPFIPLGMSCDIFQKGEWITLKFPVKPELAQHVALIFPAGSVTRGDTVEVRPFRFERIDDSTQGPSIPTRASISPPALPRVTPRFAPFENATSMPRNVKGTWVVDGKGTEELLEKIPRPHRADKLVQWFGLASGYMALFTYEFDGNKAKLSAFRGSKVQEFERVSDQDHETTYALIDATNAKSETLSVSMLKNGAIRIVPSSSPELTYLRWKPGALKAETVTSDDVMAASGVWLASVQRVVERLNSLPDPDATVDWTDEVLLHDGKMIVANRHAEKSDAYQHRIEFRHPQTQEKVVWKGERNFTPVLLDIVESTPYIVLYGRPDKKTAELYGCPELPYIYQQYTAKRWRTIPVEQAPSQLLNANLSLSDVRSKDGRHFSALDVGRDVQFHEGQSSGQVQAKIPRSYDEWHSKHKESALNERQFGDCRPPRVLPPQVSLPAASEGSPEILETIDYTPDRIATGDDWSSFVSDKKRDGACKGLFRATDPNDRMQGQRFVNDSTGTKPVPYSRSAQFNMGVRVLCDGHVWFVTHQEEPGKIVISKFTVTGDMVYRTSFRKPDRVEGFVSYIRIPSLRTEGGYLYFDWLDFRDIGREWHIKRWLKMRMREPLQVGDDKR